MANQNELVSIVMATYNGGKYLSEQLNSIIQQTYKNIEIVIVDDSSTDDTVDIIKKYQQQFSFISLHINETNNGVTVTFAKAIAESKGSLIAISDQDDIWELNKIETLVNNIEDFDAVYSNSLLVDAHGNSLNKSFTSIMNMKTYRCGAPFLLSNSVPGHTMLIRNSFAKTLFPFPPTVLFDLWICFCASSNNGIKYVDEILVKYRQHSTNTIGTSSSQNKRVKKTKQEIFELKIKELKILLNGPIKDEKTQKILQEMILLFNRRWSFKRCYFFFKYFDEILVSKQKPAYRKILYCFKMFFKPNF